MNFVETRRLQLIEAEKRIKENRDKSIHLVDSVRTKTYKTFYGTIKFKRTRYKDRNNNTYYLPEQYDLLEKSSQIDKQMVDAILRMVKNKTSYSKVVENLGLEIHPNTVANIVRRYKYEDQKYQFNTNKVYIEVDDAWIKLKNKKTIRVRMAVIHDNVIVKKEIQNKKILLQFGTERINLVSKIKEFLNPDIVKELVVLGDGATWIKNLAKKLKATFVLDKWHLFSNVFKVFGYGKYKTLNKVLFRDYADENKISIFKKFKQLVNENLLTESYDFIIQVYKTYTDKVGELKNEEMLELLNYINNNLEWLPTSDIRSHTESFVSHYIKNKVVRNFTFYKLDTIKTLLKLNESPTVRYYFLN